jgi:hypothetical protein
MALTWNEIRDNAIRFSKKWKDAFNEEAESQSFLTEFMAVFGVRGDYFFEYRVDIDDGRRGYFDLIQKGKIGIEMKTRGKDLAKAYDQIKEYTVHLPADEIPGLLMVSDFENIVLHYRSTGESKSFKTAKLKDHVKLFSDIAGYEPTREYDPEIDVNVKASEKMARLHDALKSHGYDGHDLEVYLVRLLFCLFADDTGIFAQGDFYNYVQNSKENGSDLSDRLSRIFEILNMPDETRAQKTLLSVDLLKFRYINGGVFADRLPPADFNAKMRMTLIECCEFDWGKISPAIFGAMFQGVMNPDERRALGAHYTSEENILKVIRPLFLDDLWAEFDRVRYNGARLEAFHEKISRLKFLDPACGCGNFLIITYRELRRIENEILKLGADSGQMMLDITPLIKVNVGQFYGIEYEDFPCQIATVGMWLMDHQMNNSVADQFGLPFCRLPLVESATIVQGNALRLDWMEIVPKREMPFIFGNPPFLGARIMGAEQKADMGAVFAGVKNYGNLDYVTAWYKKAAEYISGTDIKVAFVSTNSVSQGEQVALLWKPLLEDFKIKIDFAYRTFKWSNEAKGKAAVHCVIIGFSMNTVSTEKIIYDEDGVPAEAVKISPYLINADTVFIESRTKPICDVPEIGIGNKPIDGGFYLFSEEERDGFLLKEPQDADLFRPWIGSHEFINRYFRYCLWLGDCTPSELKARPEALKRIEAVRDFRLSSASAGTRKIADTPTRFHVENMPTSDYIVIPEVSSERRKYIPIGFLTPDILCSNLVKIIPNATLYHFGILTSNVHNAWMRAVAGRLKSDYRYSKDIVYNNFPWAEVNDEQKKLVEDLAQDILGARALYPDSSLADLYAPLTMPPELSKAHKKLDKLIMRLYGGENWQSEAECVAALMQRYQSITANAQRSDK